VLEGLVCCAGRFRSLAGFGMSSLWFGDRPLRLFCLSSVYLDVSSVTYLESLSLEELDRFCLWGQAWFTYNRRRSVWMRRLLTPVSWLVGEGLYYLGFLSVRDSWFEFVCWLCCFGELPSLKAFGPCEVDPCFGVWASLSSIYYPRRSCDLFAFVPVHPTPAL